MIFCLLLKEWGGIYRTEDIQKVVTSSLFTLAELCFELNWQNSSKYEMIDVHKILHLISKVFANESEKSFEEKFPCC